MLDDRGRGQPTYSVVIMTYVHMRKRSSVEVVKETKTHTSWIRRQEGDAIDDRSSLGLRTDFHEL